MITIEGTAIKGGVAIAISAVLTTHLGMDSISPDLLQEGIDAIKQSLSPKDYPEAVVVCDNTALGIALKIPGIKTIAVASEKDMDVPGIQIDIPCVTNLPNLLDSVMEGNIIIVDGNKGVVYIDPDPHMLMHYQQINEHYNRSKFFIDSAHIPAQTQRGETVMVYAYVTSSQEIDQAIEQGADGLLIDIPGSEIDSYEYYQALFRAAAGKPLAIIVDFSPYELLRAAMHYAAPGQVALIHRLNDFACLSNEVDSAIQSIEVEAYINDLDPPAISVGLLIHDDEFSEELPATYCRAIDLRKSDIMEDAIDDLGLRLDTWIEYRNPEEVILIVGDGVEALKALIEAGGRCVAVKPDKVSDAKYTIRSIGLEEEN